MIRSSLGNTFSLYSQKNVLFSAKEKQSKKNGLEKTPSTVSSTAMLANETPNRDNNNIVKKGMSAGLWIKRVGLLALGVTASDTGAFGAIVSDQGKKTRTNPNQALLQKPPFPPKNVDLLRFPIYPTAIVYPPATSLASAWQGSNLKTSITKTMAKLYQAMNPSLNLTKATRRGEQAAKVIDNKTIKQFIPDVRLRTALALLKGTAADDAINVIKSGVFHNVTFVDMDPGIMGMSSTLSDGTKIIKINSRYQQEDPRFIASTLAHEIFHQDATNSLPEETISYASDAIIYGQHVLADATLPLQKTELTQRNNIKLMARMNCRDALTGNLRITSCNGDNLLPNSNTTLKTFADILSVVDSSQVSPTSSGNSYLRDVSQKLTGQDLGENVDFSNTTLASLDASQKLFNFKQLVKIARNLQLDVDA